MKSLALWILGGMLVSFPSALLAADAKGVGIVKGTVTVGGKPATDAVVSIEGLSKQQIKTQMLLHKPRKTIIDQRNLKFTPTVVAIIQVVAQRLFQGRRERFRSRSLPAG
jgi:hypothetical protein